MAKRSKSSDSFDLDDPELPKSIDKAALGSGGYPYDDKLDRKTYETELEALQIELCKLQVHMLKSGERLVVVMARRRTFPALRCGSSGGGSMNAIVTWPLRTPVATSAVLLNGTYSNGEPVNCLNCSVTSWNTPDVPP